MLWVFLAYFYFMCLYKQSEVHLLRFEQTQTKYYEDKILLDPISKTYLVISFDSNKFNLIFPSQPDVEILSLSPGNQDYKTFDEFNLSSIRANADNWIAEIISNKALQKRAIQILIRNPTNNYQYIGLQMIPWMSSGSSIKIFLNIVIAIIIAQIVFTVFIVVKWRKNAVEVAGTYFGFQGGLKSENENKPSETLMSQISFWSGQSHTVKDQEKKHDPNYVQQVKKNQEYNYPELSTINNGAE